MERHPRTIVVVSRERISVKLHPGLVSGTLVFTSTPPGVETNVCRRATIATRGATRRSISTTTTVTAAAAAATAAAATTTAAAAAAVAAAFMRHLLLLSSF